MAMVGAAVAVFAGGAAEFRHGDQDYVAHAIAQVLPERREALAEFREALRQLSLGGPLADLVDVMVPSADIGERHFHADIRFDQPRDLAQALAETPARIFGAGLVGLLRDGLQQRYGIEGFAAGSAEDRVR